MALITQTNSRCFWMRSIRRAKGRRGAENWTDEPPTDFFLKQLKLLFSPPHYQKKLGLMSPFFWGREEGQSTSNWVNYRAITGLSSHLCSRGHLGFSRWSEIYCCRTSVFCHRFLCWGLHSHFSNHLRLHRWSGVLRLC